MPPRKASAPKSRRAGSRRSKAAIGRAPKSILAPASPALGGSWAMAVPVRLAIRASASAGRRIAFMKFAVEGARDGSSDALAWARPAWSRLRLFEEFGELLGHRAAEFLG